MRRLSAALAVVLIAAVGPSNVGSSRVAPSGSDTTTLSGATAAAPVNAPNPDTSDCKEPLEALTTLTIFDRYSEHIADLGRASTAVFEGTITTIGSAEWNTLDGKAPDHGGATLVRRMTTVRVGTAGKGVVDGDVTVALPGGTIGCTTYQLGGFADVHVGDRIVLFVEQFGETKLQGLGMATVGWLVGPDGMVDTPEDGVMDATRVVELAGP